MRRSLDGTGCLAEADAGPKCQFSACINDQWKIARFCQNHLLQAVDACRQQGCLAFERSQGKLRASGISTAFDAWKYLEQVQIDCPPEWQRTKVMFKNQDPDLFFVDIEGNMAKGLVHEATIVGSDGKVLLYAHIDYGCSTAELYEQARNLLHDPISYIIACRTIRKVYEQAPRYNLSSTPAVRLTPAEFLERCKRIGISPSSTVIGWDHYGCDLRALRITTAPYGGHTLLPKVGSSPSPIQLWRRILPKSFSFKLKLLFPLFFPNDPLVGWNHFSLPDTFQLYKMIQLAFGLFRPVESEGYLMLGYSNIRLPAISRNQRQRIPIIRRNWLTKGRDWLR